MNSEFLKQIHCVVLGNGSICGAEGNSISSSLYLTLFLIQTALSLQLSGWVSSICATTDPWSFPYINLEFSQKDMIRTLDSKLY